MADFEVDPDFNDALVALKDGMLLPLFIEGREYVVMSRETFDRSKEEPRAEEVTSKPHRVCSWCESDYEAASVCAH